MRVLGTGSLVIRRRVLRAVGVPQNPGSRTLIIQVCASLHPGVKMGTFKFNREGNLSID